MPHVAAVSSGGFHFTRWSHFKSSAGHFKRTVVLPGVLGLTLSSSVPSRFPGCLFISSPHASTLQQSLLPSSCLPDGSFLPLHGEDGKLLPLWLGLISPHFAAKAPSSSPCALDPTPRPHSGACVRKSLASSDFPFHGQTFPISPHSRS